VPGGKGIISVGFATRFVYSFVAALRNPGKCDRIAASRKTVFCRPWIFFHARDDFHIQIFKDRSLIKHGSIICSMNATRCRRFDSFEMLGWRLETLVTPYFPGVAHAGNGSSVSRLFSSAPLLVVDPSSLQDPLQGRLFSNENVSKPPSSSSRMHWGGAAAEGWKPVDFSFVLLWSAALASLALLRHLSATPDNDQRAPQPTYKYTHRPLQKR
jgi:hypothetical protein